MQNESDFSPFAQCAKSVFLICSNRLRVAHLLRENDCFALFEISKSNFVKMEKNTIFFDF